MVNARTSRFQTPKDSWITDRADGAVISVLASPKSSTNQIGPIEGSELRVRITAAASGGAANSAIVKALAEATRIPKSRIEIVTGHGSRHKRILFLGASATEIKDRLQSSN